MIKSKYNMESKWVEKSRSKIILWKLLVHLYSNANSNSKLLGPIVKRPTALGLAFEGRSRQFHTMPKKGNFLPDSKAKKRKMASNNSLLFFFLALWEKKADIVVFVRDIFLHDLQFSHSLGLVKHSHFISKVC